MLRSPTSLGSCESSQYGVREGWPMVGLMQFDTCIDIQEVKIYFDLQHINMFTVCTYSIYAYINYVIANWWLKLVVQYPRTPIESIPLGKNQALPRIVFNNIDKFYTHQDRYCAPTSSIPSLKPTVAPQKLRQVFGRLVGIYIYIYVYRHGFGKGLLRSYV